MVAEWFVHLLKKTLVQVDSPAETRFIVLTNTGVSGASSLMKMGVGQFSDISGNWLER